MRNRTTELHYKGLLKSKTYAPDKLMDALIERYKLKSDASLSRALRVSPALISKLRSKETPVTASVLLRIYDALGMGIDEARQLMGAEPAVPRLPMSQG